ncbi:hypothetical protein [Parabacteroides chinchillae]
MKEFLSSISIVVLSFATTIPIVAQQQLTVQQKKTIKTEVVPVLFDQLKQQTGIDFLEFANHQLSIESIVNSQLFIPQNSLRADESSTPVNIKPDNVVLKASAINEILAQMTENDTLKITFENYQKVTLPVEIGTYSTSIDMPMTIKANVYQSGQWLPLAIVNIKITPESEGSILGKTVISLDIMGGGENPILTLNLSQDKTTYAIVADVTLEQMLRELLTLTGVTIPEYNYQVTIGISDMLIKGYIPFSLYGIPTTTGTNKIPMGDANVFISFDNPMPIQMIQIKSYTYTTNGAPTNSYKKLTFSIAQKNENLTITIQDSTSNEGWTSNTYAGTKLITMTDYSKIPTTATSALVLAIDHAVRAVEGNTNPNYKMLIQSAKDANGDGVISDNEIISNDMEIDVSTNLDVTTGKAVANASIKQMNNETMQLTATVPLKERRIAVEIAPVKNGVATPIATAYFLSNISGIITSNETSPVLEKTCVYAQAGGIYIENADKAAYSVTGINGGLIAQGIIAGANEYVTIPNQMKGNIYIVTIMKDNVRKSFKFKAN